MNIDTRRSQDLGRRRRDRRRLLRPAKRRPPPIRVRRLPPAGRRESAVGRRRALPFEPSDPARDDRHASTAASGRSFARAGSAEPHVRLARQATPGGGCDRVPPRLPSADGGQAGRRRRRAARAPLDCGAAARDAQVADGAVYRAGLTGKYFHPLGSFGKLNRAVGAADRRRAKRLARSLIARGRRQGRFGLVWFYNVPGGRSGWTSGLARAVAAQALARARKKGGGAPRVPRDSRPAADPAPAGPWIKLYGYSNVVVLNAQLQAALSISHYARLTNDTRARLLARQLRRTAKALLPRFDNGSWSRYSLGGRSATLEYHEYVTALLWKLSARQHGGRWRVYADRFSKYRRIPPVLRRGDRAPEVCRSGRLPRLRRSRSGSRSRRP